jgi:CheY-like chemotaxis protein
MKLLIVEDDENNISLFEGELASSEGCEVTFARSRDSALELLNAGTFDLVVLDLRIPPQDGGLDASVDHGLAVHSRVQEISPGTPIIVFSAYGTLKLATKLAENSERHDIWGCGQEEPMTLYKEKSDFIECLSHIAKVLEHVSALGTIEVSTGGRALDLTHGHKRILRIFSRLNAGINIVVSPLGGGLSGAKTLRIEVQNEHATTTSFAVAKLGSIQDLHDEQARYEKCIAPAMAVGGFAHLIRFIRAGASNTGGIFYGFAKDYQQTLIQILSSDPARATATVAELRSMEKNWQDNAVNRPITVGDIRRFLVKDEAFDKFSAGLDFDWSGLEQTQVRMKWCCQHGDFHGLNILVRDGERPLLIDYGEVGHGPACLDPLILELSLLFHPGCKQACGGWPSTTQASNWANVGEYTKDTPIAPFIRACREWAFAVQPVDKGVYATAYAYSVRQLKFPDTDHNLARTIARAAYNAFVQT